VATLRNGGIIKIVMTCYGLARKDWTALFSVVAGGQDIVERLPGELVHILRAMRTRTRFLSGIGGFYRSVGNENFGSVRRKRGRQPAGKEGLRL
jgi:hypothetical protein